jgi:hypothetical protein
MVAEYELQCGNRMRDVSGRYTEDLALNLFVRSGDNNNAKEWFEVAISLCNYTVDGKNMLPKVAIVFRDFAHSHQSSSDPTDI